MNYRGMKVILYVYLNFAKPVTSNLKLHTDMKKHINTLLTITSVFLLAAAMSSCGNRQAKEAEELQSESKEQTFEQLTNYPIPTSFEVIQMINKAGASFIIGICNPVDNVGKYITEKAKAVNLGIYGADLAYSTTYQMKQETMNYLKVSKQLVDELNISTGFNRQLAENVEKNLDNKDSLIVIITNSYYDTYKTLVENNKESLSLLVVAGSWIEGVYITSQIALTSRNNTEFIKILANQKAPLTKLMELMAARTHVLEVKELMDMLAPINTIYNQVQGENLTNEQFQKIMEEITKVRNALV